MHSINKSLKFLINRIIAFDKAALVEQCKSRSRGQVEKPMKKVRFIVEDSEIPETQPVVVEDVRMGTSKGRQHSLWNSSRPKDRQIEHMRPRERFRLAELVGNAEVGDTTCRRVSFRVRAKRKLRKPNTIEESKGGLDLRGMHAK
ncbi:hypothetical protein CDL15_Pgr026411 [Punica granatum]|nr:hypothetical protein CDL15_Pgr026411 [Punica granatum]